MKIKIEGKRLAALISSLVLLAVSIILLIVFFVLSKDNSSAQQTILRINANDAVMFCGETRENYYDINSDDAVVTIEVDKEGIEVDKEGIIDINTDRIIALKSGSVSITLTANFNGAVSKDTFKVTVISHDYSFNIIPTASCEYENGVLYTSSNTAQFNIELYDLNGEIIQNPTIECSASDGAILQKQFGNYILLSENDCELYFNIEELDFSFTIEVVLV